MPSEETQFKSGPAHHFGKRNCCSHGHAYVEGSFKIVVKDGRPYRHCRICSRASSSRSHQKYHYGITNKQRDALFVKQGNCCAVCKSKEHGGRGWNTDHDHITKVVRGILCRPCNLALGLLKENITTLQNLVLYLQK